MQRRLRNPRIGILNLHPAREEEKKKSLILPKDLGGTETGNESITDTSCFSTGRRTPVHLLSGSGLGTETIP